MRVVYLVFSALAACNAPLALEDTQRVEVEEGGATLAIAQRFDADGALVETIVTSPGEVLSVDGVLLTDEGTTAAGESVRQRLASLDPRLVARLVLAEPRFDIAVLAADALLSLDEPHRARAGSVFAQARGTNAAVPLCAHLAACEDELGAPRT